MKRLKINKTKNDLALAAQKYDAIDGKQIIGHARISPSGGDPITVYELEDGKRHIEDDAGKKKRSLKVTYKKRSEEGTNE